MKIEVLFPEFCNLFGDPANIRYLKKCLPEAEIIETPLGGEPLFAREAPNLIYLAPMTERTQERVITALLPYRERIEELINHGTAFLFTGNAMEVLGESIEDGAEKTEGLGILPISAKRDMLKRHNSVFLGSFEGKPLMGFKSQFSMAYPKDGAEGLFPAAKGVGLNPKCPFEGIRKRNFFGTYLLGPVLILNPDFTKYLMAVMGAPGREVAFSDAVYAAYEKRLKDFRQKA